MWDRPAEEATCRPDLFLAIAGGQPGTGKPTPLEKFAAGHLSKQVSTATTGTPDSYAQEAYFGIDAFVFVTASGKRQAVRYEAVLDRVVHLAPADAAKRKPNPTSSRQT